MATERVQANLIIRGRVQGVNYRASTQAMARHLGVTGWVKNLPDRSVQAVAEGPRRQVEELVAWCHRGPPASRVDSVEVTFAGPTGDFSEFEMRY